MGDTHQFYVAPSKAHGEKAVSGLACAYAVGVRFLYGEPQVQAHGGPAPDLKGYVDDQVVVLRLHEEDASVVHAIQPPASARSSVSISCGVMMPRSSMPLPCKCGATPGSLPSVVGSETGSSGPHIRDHLAEEARRFDDGRLRLYKYTPGIEHTALTKRAPARAEGGGSVASERGVSTMVLYRIWQ